MVSEFYYTSMTTGKVLVIHHILWSFMLLNDRSILKVKCEMQEAKEKPNIFLLSNILFLLCLSCPKDFFLSSESQQANNLKMIRIDFTDYTTVLLEFFCLQQKVIFVVLKSGQLIQWKEQCAESTVRP